MIGNHELLLAAAIQYAQPSATDMWKACGGGWVDPLMLPAEWADRLAALPLAIEVPLKDGRLVGVVHAELPPQHQWADIHNGQVTLEDAIRQGDRLVGSLMWGRSRVKSAMRVRTSPRAWRVSLHDRIDTLHDLAPVAGVDLLIMGHTQLHPRRPLRAENLQWLDTGAGFPQGILSMIDPVAGICVQSGKPMSARITELEAAVNLKHWRLSDRQLNRTRS